MRLFLLGDAAACAKAGQKVPEGYYNVQLTRGTLADLAAWTQWADKVLVF